MLNNAFILKSAEVQKSPTDFCKPRTSLLLSNVSREVLEFIFKPPNVGHPHTVREMLEHDLVVGGVAHINPLVEFFF
jgi:hypothetical protein